MKNCCIVHWFGCKLIGSPSLNKDFKFELNWLPRARKVKYGQVGFPISGRKVK